MIRPPLLVALALTAAMTAFIAWREANDAPEAQEMQEMHETPERAGNGIPPDRPSPPMPRIPPLAADEADAPGEGAKPAGDGVNGVRDIFPAQTWAPPPPPPPGPPAEKRPETAPPLPFSLRGWWTQGLTRYAVVEAAGQRFLLCNACDATDRITPGNLVLPAYRLASFDGQTLVFTYLPLNERQSLSLGIPQ